MHIQKTFSRRLRLKNLITLNLVFFPYISGVISKCIFSSSWGEFHKIYITTNNVIYVYSTFLHFYNITFLYFYITMWKLQCKFLWNSTPGLGLLLRCWATFPSPPSRLLILCHTQSPGLLYRAIRDRSCECAAVCERRAGHNILYTGHRILLKKVCVFRHFICYYWVLYSLQTAQICSAWKRYRTICHVQDPPLAQVFGRPPPHACSHSATWYTHTPLSTSIRGSHIQGREGGKKASPYRTTVTPPFPLSPTVKGSFMPPPPPPPRNNIPFLLIEPDFPPSSVRSVGIPIDEPHPPPEPISYLVPYELFGTLIYCVSPHKTLNPTIIYGYTFFPLIAVVVLPLRNTTIQQKKNPSCTESGDGMCLVRGSGICRGTYEEKIPDGRLECMDVFVSRSEAWIPSDPQLHVVVAPPLGCFVQ